MNNKTRTAIKKLADVLTIAENCVTADIIPHDSVEMGESNGDLKLTFSGGSGENFSTDVVVFRNSALAWSGTLYDPDTEVVIEGQSPPTLNDIIYVLYRATCEGSDSGDGGWRVGFYRDFSPE